MISTNYNLNAITHTCTSPSDNSVGTCYIPTSIYNSLSPVEQIDRSFSILGSRLKAALKKEVDPVVHIMSADCGTGKGLAVEKVINEWKADGFPGDGAIIFVSTLEEIDRFISGAGLDREDYAVCSPDEKYSRYGSGLHAVNQVPVLFATHAKAEKVLRGRESVEDATEFLLHGRRRALWIWDEAFHAAAWASFTLHELWELPTALKKLGKRYVQVVADLAHAATEVEGARLPIPLAIGEVADALFLSKVAVSETARRTVAEVAKLAGSTATARKDSGGEWRFLGKGRSFPADMAPLFVLDASARLTDRYNHLPAYGMKVAHLDPAAVHYGPLAIHCCDMSAGKTAMRNAVERDVVFRIIADLVNSKPAKAFLLIMAKEFYKLTHDGRVIIPDGLVNLLDDPNQLLATNWGRHKGTNEFRDIPNIIIVGDHRYPSHAYAALAVAAYGNDNGLANKSQCDQQADEAFMDNVYQAVCRSTVRQRDGASSAAANAYFIMQHSDRKLALIKRAFPGCRVTEWCPATGKRKTMIELAIDALPGLMKGRVEVKKSELQEAIGEKYPQSMGRIYKSQRFKDVASALGVEIGRASLRNSTILKLAA